MWLKKGEVIFLFLFALLFCLPIFLTTGSTFPRLDSDFDAELPIYQYIGQYIRINHSLPSSIPFVSSGIPFLGNPINGFFNPLIAIPLILFNINIAIRITFFLVVFTSGLTMFWVLKNIKIKENIQYFGSILYMTSGGLIATIAAGHITEKLLIFPIIPIFFFFITSPKLSFNKMLLTSILISFTVFSGDLYMTWFFFIFLFSATIWWIFREKEEKLKRLTYFLTTFPIFLFVTFPVLYPFFVKVLPEMYRPTEINPFIGSIHTIFLPLQFLMPLQVNFYDRPFFERLFGFHYNWYEYYGFVGFFSVVFFKNIGKVIKDERFRLLLVLLLVGSLYLSSKYVYSPFHYIFEFIKSTDVFRVPQRIVVPLTSIIVMLVAILASSWKRQFSLNVLFTLSIIWTFSIGWFTFSNTFVPIHKENLIFAKKVAEIDSKKLAVVNFGATNQIFLTERNIPILNYYYAWIPKSAPRFITLNGKIDLDVTKKIRPAFILSGHKIDITNFGYTLTYQQGNKQIWQKNL